MGGTSNSVPGPTDYSAAMMGDSSNKLFAQLSQTSTQQLLGQLMAFNQSQQIATSGMVALAGFDAKLDIARLNFQLAEEGMEMELEKFGDEIDLRKEELRQEGKEFREETRLREQELHIQELEATRPTIETVDTGDWRT